MNLTESIGFEQLQLAGWGAPSYSKLKHAARIVANAYGEIKADLLIERMGIARKPALSLLGTLHKKKIIVRISNGIYKKRDKK